MRKKCAGRAEAGGTCLAFYRAAVRHIKKSLRGMCQKSNTTVYRLFSTDSYPTPRPSYIYVSLILLGYEKLKRGNLWSRRGAFAAPDEVGISV